MRKTFTVLAVVVIVAALFATPGLVAAGGGNGGGRGGGNGSGGNGGGSHRGGNGGTWFNLDGTILGDPDDVARTFVVDVDTPDSYKEPITVQVTEDTRLKLCDSLYRIDFEELDDGEWVRVVGVIEDGTYIATRVILY